MDTYIFLIPVYLSPSMTEIAFRSDKLNANLNDITEDWLTLNQLLLNLHFSRDWSWRRRADVV